MKTNLIFIVFFFCALNIGAHKEKWDENKEDWTPLMCVIYYGCSDCRDEFINQNIDINEISKTKKMTALDVAIKIQDTESVNALLKTGCISDINKYIIDACFGKNVDIVELLIQYGADPNNSLANNYSPLMGAASFGSKEIMMLLLNHKVNIDQERTVDGITALILAAHNGDIDKVKLLLEAGANKNLLNKNGKRAFDYVDKIPPYIIDENNITDEDKRELKKLLE